MTAREAQCIISVAKHKSISKAAKEVFVTQQALSKIVDRVEKEIDARLFSRLTSGIEITDLGSRIIPVIISLYSSYERHIKIINDIIEKEKKEREILTISVEHKYLSTLIPEDLLTSFSILQIKLVLANTIEKCIDDVSGGKYSMGVCHKREKFGGLEYIPIIDETAHVLMHKDHFLAINKELVLSDLRGVPMFDMLSEGTPNEILISAFANEGFYPAYISGIDSLDTMLRNIRSGAGVVIGSRFYIPDNCDDIVCVPLKHRSINMAVGFIVRPDAPLPIRSFIRAVTACHSG
ncbi:MAG: LysR family transcriptional regulator [Spirochaetaceae bacterium]|jgi:DNA-binding transcriptional LysR family regulator|nr:LysR family transcriptional regulator [Spirochaetaceae bacterium]